MKMTTTQRKELLEQLKRRFAANPRRHEGMAWSAVEARLQAAPDRLAVLLGMERTGGEPDVIGVEPATGALVFCDCAEESPAGRRSLCYDREAWESRKEHRPSGNILDLASTLGIELLSEEDYRRLQTVGEFDQRTSSWLKTPDSIRRLGGALFGDRRYGTVFVYHNGASSYYAARGFRGKVLV